MLRLRSQQSAFGEFAGSDTIAAALRQAREDSSIRAVVLRVDSPGGTIKRSSPAWAESVSSSPVAGK